MTHIKSTAGQPASNVTHLSENTNLNAWQSATGPLIVPLTNDYMFRALLQRNNKVLKGLICSLLHLSPEEISTVVITNPIELGNAIDDKTFILDIKVSLNDYTLINLEMQVINEHNWVERSLSYLCRNFDNLKGGEAYQNVRPAVQIGILNFTLFSEHPEFYATYKLLNVKSYTLYSDKLCLSVLDLTHIDLATEEDKRYQIDYWASLFKAITWEELKQLAQNNEYIREVAETVYVLSQEEKIRQQCEAREDYYRRQKGIQDQLDQLKEKEGMLEKQEETLKRQEERLKEQKETLKEQEETLKEQEETLKEQEETLKEQEETLKEQKEMLAEKEKLIDALVSENEALRASLAVLRDNPPEK